MSPRGEQIGGDAGHGVYFIGAKEQMALSHTRLEVVIRKDGKRHEVSQTIDREAAAERRMKRKEGRASQARRAGPQEAHRNAGRGDRPLHRRPVRIGKTKAQVLQALKVDGIAGVMSMASAPPVAHTVRPVSTLSTVPPAVASSTVTPVAALSTVTPVVLVLVCSGVAAVEAVPAAPLATSAPPPSWPGRGQ